MKLHKISLFLLSIMVITGYIIFSFTSNALPQADFRRLMEVSTPGVNQRILIFSPHPDDETVAVGGFIYSARQAGAEVHIILVSDGNKHGLKDLRYHEFLNATKILGVPSDQLEFWGFPDGKLSMFSTEIRADIAREIAIYNPTIIIYPFLADSHPDHSALGFDVDKELQSMGKGGENIVSYSYLVHYSYFPEPSVLKRGDNLLPPAALRNENWGRYILTDAARQVKKEAVMTYKSQRHNPYLRTLFGQLMRSNELIVRRTIRKSVLK